MTALLCAALSGVMFYLSQGLNDVWWLAWIAPVPLLWLAYGETSRWQLFLATLAAYACGQIYLVQVYFGTLPPAAMALMIFGTSAFFAAAVVFAHTIWRKLSRWAALAAFPACWAAIEFALSLISPHGSWGALAYSQVSFPAGIQIASLFGLYSITFSLCLFANALALGARGAWNPAFVGIALCTLGLAFGHAQLMAPAGEKMHVAALADWKGRLETTRKLNFDATHAMAERYAEAAAREADKGARFIVIPETALAADPAWRDAALAPLAQAARQKRITIVAGVVLVKPWRNAALSFLPDGGMRDYDKRHLLLPGEDKFKPGLGPGPLGDGKSVAICKDLDFPRTLRSDAQAGIRLMAVPANDFVKDNWIHARMAVMRGVENGFAMVRSAFNGLETISDAQGRILASAPTSGVSMTAIAADVPPGPGPTLYTRIGDMFAWLCVLAFLLLGFLAIRAGGSGRERPREV